VHANIDVSAASRVPPSPTTPTGILKKSSPLQTVYKSSKFDAIPCSAKSSPHLHFFRGWWVEVSLALFLSSAMGEGSSANECGCVKSNNE
jgi:hypothetical protein